MTIFDIDDSYKNPTPQGAVFSPCRQWRYTLWRKWSSNKPAVFIGLNRSTADETQDDPTVRRCVGFARRWDCGGLVMLNLYGWRSTDPKPLWDGSMVDPVGPEMDHYI